MKLLIGNTGLIGSTLKEKIKFDLEFNSSNMNKFESSVVDSCDLYLACLPATKWIVNKNILKDLNNINQIINQLSTKKYNNIYLFSTIDIYSFCDLQANEDNHPIIKNLNYGINRFLFERMVDELLKYNNLKIFRLPALFNKNIKKNILFDLLNNNNIDKININSYFQWYNLDNLATDIYKYNNEYKTEKIFNLFPEPLSTEEIVKFFPYFKNKFKFSDNKIIYDYKTKYNKNGYIKLKEQVLSEIETFINETRDKSISMG